MPLLAIETSCDETSAAVIDRGRLLSNVIASQIDLHREFGGVVPELATREHLTNLPRIISEALQAASTTMKQVDAVAATRGPGLPGALVIGTKMGQSLAYARNLPFFGIHHHEAHLFSPWIDGQVEYRPIEPSVSLIVSGGHTLLVHVRSESDFAVVGQTRDDAAGECFDKTAKLLGLPYPGGPEIDRLADTGDDKVHRFPRPLLADPNLDFSFSGLKTSVRYFLQAHPEAVATSAGVANICAGIRAAIVEVLVEKTIRAARQCRVEVVGVSGGVACNRKLRKQFETRCTQEGLRLRIVDKTLATDNAAMIGVLAERKFLRGDVPTAYDLEIDPGWKLA